MLQPSTSRATAEQLQEFYRELSPHSLGALWTAQEDALTREPRSKAIPYLWPWREIKHKA